MKHINPNKSFIFFPLIIALTFFCTVSISAQSDSTKSGMMNESHMNMMQDSTHRQMMEKMPMKKDKMKSMMPDSMQRGSHMKPEKMNNMDHQMNMNSMNSKNMNNSPLIRKGTVDLKSIDKNEDGKVYEDMMDWNVISDKPGECPICGMTLKEATLKQAKENLLKHHYKVK